MHQTWHSQHAHVRWEELARPVLTVGGPNGNETILILDRERKRGRDGRTGPIPALQVFDTNGMSPTEITALLRNHRGYLIDGRAK